MYRNIQPDLTLYTWLIALCLFILAGSAPAASSLQAQLDRNRIVEGEVVNLTVTVHGDSNGEPDLAPLNKDFEILSRGQSSNMRIINGRVSSSREWKLVLEPKRMGRLTVPSLSLGGAVSQPLVLEVVEAAQAPNDGRLRPVMLEAEVSTPTPYVQGKVVYVVRLLSQTPLKQATLSEPEVEGAIVERLGEDNKFQTRIGGQTYLGLERRYAIFPQRSGPLKITGPLLSGEIPEQNPRKGSSLRDRFFGGRDPFADFDRMFGMDPFSGMPGSGRSVRMRAQAQQLEVQPQPPGSASPWLPAESVTLNETWAPDPPEFRTGEPVTRTIAIVAQGVSATQLPDLEQTVPDGISVYPDRPQSETRADGDTLVAQKVLKTALVPSRPGTYQLPGIVLNWWDTNTGRQRTERIPAREIEVLPGAAPAPAPAPTPVPVPEQAPQQTAAPAAPQAQGTGTAQSARSSTDAGDTSPDLIGVIRDSLGQAGAAGFWPWLTLLFAIAWLISTLLWLNARRAQHKGRTVAKRARAAIAANPRPVLNRFEQACRQNDPRAAREALLEWAGAVWPQQRPQRLDQLTNYLPPEAAPALQQLDRVLYAPDNADWDGANALSELRPCLEQAGKSPGQAEQGGPLPPLYAGQ